MPTSLIIVQDLAVHAQKIIDEPVEFTEPELRPLAAAYCRHQRASQQNFAGISGYLNSLPFILMTHGNNKSAARAQQIFLRLLVDRLPGFIEELKVEAAREEVEKNLIAEIKDLGFSVFNFNASFSMLLGYKSDDGKNYIFSFRSNGVATVIDNPMNGRNNMTTCGELAFLNEVKLQDLQLRCNRTPLHENDCLYAYCGEMRGANEDLLSAPAASVQTYFSMKLAVLSGEKAEEEQALFFAAMQKRKRSFSINGERTSFFSQNCSAMADLASIKELAKSLNEANVLNPLSDKTQRHKQDLEKLSQQYKSTYPIQLHYLCEVILIAARFRFTDLTLKHRQRGCLFHWDVYKQVIDEATKNYERFNKNKGEMSLQVQQVWHASLFRLLKNLYNVGQYVDSKDLWYKQCHAFITRNDFFVPWSVDGWFKSRYQSRYESEVNDLSDKARNLVGYCKVLNEDLSPEWETLSLVKQLELLDSNGRVCPLPSPRLS